MARELILTGIEAEARRAADQAKIARLLSWVARGKTRPRRAFRLSLVSGNPALMRMAWRLDALRVASAPPGADGRLAAYRP